MTSESTHDLPADLLDRPGAEGARWLAMACLRELIVARRRLDDQDDVAALHDFRVALRRLRTVLRAYRAVLRDSVPRKIRRRLRRMASAAGATRDCDVRLRLLGERTASDAAAPPRNDWIDRQLQHDRDAAFRQFRRQVTRHFDQVTKQLDNRLQRYRVTCKIGEQSEPTVARSLFSASLDTLATTLAGQSEAIHTVADRSVLHHTRIAAKRLRYGLEPFAVSGVVPAAIARKAGAVTKELTTVQDRLGQVHDLQGFADWLADRGAELAARDERREPGWRDEPAKAGDVSRQADAAARREIRETRRWLNRRATQLFRAVRTKPNQRRLARTIQSAHMIAGKLGRR